MKSGTKLGHYEILSLLGKGGMGEVWRARDTKLGREVAIKTLPEEFAKDANRLARFEREAKLLASLNHPNIAAIHGFEEDNGTHFLVLELVEGDTLADQLKRGAIPVEESLKLALQIAEALEAAHEEGVIHRDLKPANIKVTPDGKLKVLDFGLAKAFEGDVADPGLSNSPTLSMAATQQGVFHGTAAYMSPEQASGSSTDKRADIWSFGVVLFEMLTGRQPFTGETVSHILAAVLKTEPEWTSLPSNLHPRLRLLLERCLQKEIADRYHDIADARLDVQTVLADPSGVLVQPSGEVVRAARQSKVGWVAASLVVAIVASLAAWNLKPTPELPPRSVTRFAYELPETLDADLSRYFLAISPKDDQIVYTTRDGLYLRPMDGFEVRLIPGTEGEESTHPFFSPDGSWVGYFSLGEGQLKKVRASGGAPVFLAEAGNPYAPFWAENGTILYAQNPPGLIMQVSENGGAPSVLVEVGGRVVGPVMLPDGESILFTVGDFNERQVVARSLDDGVQETLFDDATTGVQYLASGHLVYGVETDIFARSFDVETWEVGGQVPLLQDTFRLFANTAPHFDVSDLGSLVYLPEEGNVIVDTLAWVDREGNLESMRSLPQGQHHQPRLSPNHQQVSVNLRNLSDLGDSSIWIYELGRSAEFPLTRTPSRSPLWSPDGLSVAYYDIASGGVLIRSADGSDEPQNMTEANDVPSHPVAWSSDGETLAVVRRGTANSWDIDMVSVGDESVRFLSDEYDEGQPTFSPNGDWVAYVSNESGERQVYLTPYPGAGMKIPLAHGDEPLWAENGELFYRTQDGNMMVVGISTEPELEIGDASILFEDRFVTDSEPTRNYDVTSDGQRFVMVARGVQGNQGAREAGLQLRVVLNWFEELKERVSAQ